MNDYVARAVTLFPAVRFHFDVCRDLLRVRFPINFTLERQVKAEFSLESFVERDSVTHNGIYNGGGGGGDSSHG